MTLPLLFFFTSISLLQAQTSALSANPSANAPAASATASPAPAGFGAAPAFTINGLGNPPSAFGQSPAQSQYRPADPFGSGSFNPRQWNGAVRDSFRPHLSFGGYSGSQGSGISPFAPPPPALPSLNQFMRGSFSLPSGPTFGVFSPSYQNILRPGANFGDLLRPSTSIVFSTTDLGNGMFLSAGTGFGHSIAGAPAAGLGSSTTGEVKHSGPSVALKLSF